jgi:hypothetical protein
LSETEWLFFAGTAERRGSVFRLAAAGSNGFVEIGEDGIGFDEAGAAYVRRGAVLMHLDEPAQRDVSGRPDAVALSGLCPGGVTACVGNLLICCGDFRVIGSAQGAWGCERPPFVPGGG